MRSLKTLNTSLIVAFMVSATLNMGQSWYHEQAKQPLLDEVVQLKRQVGFAAPVVTATPTPTPVPTEMPLVAGQSAVKISFFNVKLVVEDPIPDLVFGQIGQGEWAAAGFTTQALIAKYPACKAGALGTLVRTKASPTTSPKPTRSPLVINSPSNQPFKKTVAGYTYSYRNPAFSCVTDQAGRNDIAAGVAALKNVALPTLAQTP